MEITVNLDSLGIGIPKTGFGVNLISGSYIQISDGTDGPVKTYGIVSTMSVGGDNSTLVYGTLKTAPIKINSDELRFFSVPSITGKYIDIEINGTIIGSGRADLTISLIDEGGRAETAIDRKNIQVTGGQLSSTRIRGRARYVAN